MVGERMVAMSYIPICYRLHFKQKTIRGGRALGCSRECTHGRLYTRVAAWSKWFSIWTVKRDTANEGVRALASRRNKKMTIISISIFVDGWWANGMLPKNFYLYGVLNLFRSDHSQHVHTIAFTLVPGPSTVVWMHWRTPRTKAKTNWIKQQSSYSKDLPQYTLYSVHIYE